MEMFLIELDYSSCKDFLLDQLTSIGNLITKVVTECPLQNGKFYCIANDNLKPSDTYEFATAIGDGPWPKDTIIKFIEYYLNLVPDNSNNLLIEHWGVDANTGFLLDKNREYFLSNDVVFYLLKSNYDELCIRNAFQKAASAWPSGFFPMLINTDLTQIEPGKNIDSETEHKILQNIVMFFMPIYDGESYLIWNKGGNDMLIKALEKYLF